MFQEQKMRLTTRKLRQAGKICICQLSWIWIARRFWGDGARNNIYLLKTFDNFFVRSLMTWRGICSHFAAGVPGRGKNWFMNKLGNLYLSHNEIVSSKSSSVSVGNPAIMSSQNLIFIKTIKMVPVAILQSGTLALSVSTTLQKSSRLYSLRIEFRTASDPDWTGTCRNE